MTPRLAQVQRLGVWGRKGPVGTLACPPHKQESPQRSREGQHQMVPRASDQEWTGRQGGHWGDRAVVVWTGLRRGTFGG